MADKLKPNNLAQSKVIKKEDGMNPAVKAALILTGTGLAVSLLNKSKKGTSKPIPTSPDSVRQKNFDTVGASVAAKDSGGSELLSDVRNSLSSRGSHSLDLLLSLSLFPLFTGILKKGLSLVRQGILVNEEDLRFFFYHQFYYKSRIDCNSGRLFPTDVMIQHTASFFTSSNNGNAKVFGSDEIGKSYGGGLDKDGTEPNAFWSREIVPFILDARNPEYMGTNKEIPYDMFRYPGHDSSVYLPKLEYNRGSGSRGPVVPIPDNEPRRFIYPFKSKGDNWLYARGQFIQTILDEHVTDWKVYEDGYLSNTCAEPFFLDNIISVHELLDSSPLLHQNSLGYYSNTVYHEVTDYESLLFGLANGEGVMSLPSMAFTDIIDMFAISPNTSKCSVFRSADGTQLGHAINLPYSAVSATPTEPFYLNDGPTNIAHVFTRLADQIANRLLRDNGQELTEPNFIAYRNTPHRDFDGTEWKKPLFLAAQMVHSYFNTKPRRG